MGIFSAAKAVSEFTSPHLKVELLSEQETLVQGNAVTVGLHFVMEKGWHIYWTNPGDSGQAPWVVWDLPLGFKAAPLSWPLPERIPLPSLMDYGYSGEVLLMTVLRVPKNLKPGRTITLSAGVHWLVCKEACVSGQAKLSLRLPVLIQKPKIKTKTRELFDSSRQNSPSPLPPVWKAEGFLSKEEFRLSFESDRPVSAAVFFPLHPNQLENAASQTFIAARRGFELRLKKSDQCPENLPSLEGLIVINEKSGKKTGYEAKVPLSLRP